MDGENGKDVSGLYVAISRAAGHALDLWNNDDHALLQNGCCILNSWGIGPVYRFVFFSEGPYAKDLFKDCRKADPNAPTDVPDETISRLAGVFSHGPGYTAAYASLTLIKDRDPGASRSAIVGKAVGVSPGLVDEIEVAALDLLGPAEGDDPIWLDACESHLQYALVVLEKKRDPVETERRMAHKRNAIAWAMGELRKPYLPDGTDQSPPEDCLFFGSYWWLALRQCILFRDGCRCALCGSTEALEVHHIHPRHLGGKDVPTNLVMLCTICHDRVHHNMDSVVKVGFRLPRLEDFDSGSAGEESDSNAPVISINVESGV